MRESLPSVAEVNKQYLDYFRKIEEEKKRKLDILTGSQFIDWLIVSLCKDKKVMYCEKNGDSSSDSINASIQLLSLFNIVKEYADRNYIISTLDEDGTSYYVEYNGLTFKIGFSVKEEPIYYAKVIKKQVDSVIPFSFIKDETLSYISIVEQKRELLELYNLVRGLKMSGFSEDDIVATTAKALKYVR